MKINEFFNKSTTLFLSILTMSLAIAALLFVAQTVFTSSGLVESGAVYATGADCSEVDPAFRTECERQQQAAADFCSGASGVNRQLCDQANLERDDRNHMWIAETCENASGSRRDFCLTQLNYNYTQGGVTLSDGTVIDSGGNIVRGSANIGNLGSGRDLNLPGVDAGQSQFQNILNIVFMIAGALATIFIIVGGIQYVMSIGSPDRIEKAKNSVLYAVIGLVVTILASVIVNFVVNNIL